MAGKGSRTISMILAIIMVLGLFPSLSPSAGAELQESDPFSVTYGIPTTGLVDAPAGIPLLTETVPQHAHHFTYSAEGNTIVAHCDATDCPLENGEARLVLKTDDAPKADHPYTGASVQNTIPLSENAVLGPVVYYSLNESELVENGAQPESFLTEENRLEIAPKRVGTYLASVTLTVDGTAYTVWNVFEIYLPKAAITVRPEPVEGLVYDGQPHALVTPGEAGANAVLYAVLANDETEPIEGFDDTFPMAADAGLYVVWFRAAGDADHEDGDTDHVVVRIQKAAQAAPSAPEAEEITAESITLKASEGYEYSMDGETWQSDNTFAALAADTEYRFFQRITGDYNLAPSPAGEAAVFRTLEAAPVAEAEAKPVKLWFVCDPPETVLSVRSSAEGSSPVSPEEDGSYLLLPGSWICSAAAEGYQPIENSEFTVSAENGDTQYMTLELQKLPPLVSPAFEETAYVSGMAVRVSAPEGVFPEGSTLSVTPVPVQEQQFVDAAVGSERGGSKNVMVSYTFDIKVIGPDGNEVQPADAQKVKVSFTANAVAEQNLSTDVYHVSGEGASLSAERLDTTEDGATVTAETSGFSYYTVEFTYETLQYVLPGGENVALSEILNTVGLSGTVTGVQCSRPDLFSADTRSGEWVVYSHQPFTSTEWMKIVINGLEYTIIVTDAPADTGIHLYDGIYEIDEIVIDKRYRPSLYLTLRYNNKPDSYTWQLEASGAFESEFISENEFNIYYKNTGNNQKWLRISLKNGNTVVSTKTVNVTIRDAALPEVQVSPSEVTINLAGTKTATVSYSYSGADSFDISLNAKGGFATYTLGAEKTESGKRSGSLTVTASATGTATLEFVALKHGQTAPIAAKTINVSVINSLVPTASEPANAATDAVANKGNSDSGQGYNFSTYGTYSVIPLLGRKATIMTEEELDYEMYLEGRKKDFWDQESTLKKQIQLYKLKEVNNRITYVYGECNLSSYITLLNRYVAYYYGDYSSPVTPEKVFNMINKNKTPKLYYFYKRSGTDYGSGTAPFTYNGKKCQPVKQYNKDDIFRCTGYIWDGEVPVPSESYSYPYNEERLGIKMLTTKTEKGNYDEKLDRYLDHYRDPANLAGLLHYNPEGIYIHATRIDDKKGKLEHAVVITDYVYENGVYRFTVIDPARNPSLEETGDEFGGQGPRTYHMECNGREDLIMDTHKLTLANIDEVGFMMNQGNIDYSAR